MLEKNNDRKPCEACGHEVAGYMNFCPMCGKQLKNPAQILTAQQIRDLHTGSQSRNADSNWR